MPEPGTEPQPIKRAGPMTLGAGQVLGWTVKHRDAVKAWLAEAVGEQTMRDTYEIAIVTEGRIRVRYFERESDGRIATRDGAPVKRELTVDWPKPPPNLRRWS